MEIKCTLDTVTTAVPGLFVLDICTNRSSEAPAAGWRLVKQCHLFLSMLLGKTVVHSDGSELLFLHFASLKPGFY